MNVSLPDSLDRVRIIIPAHNEEQRILPTLEAYCAYFGERATITVVLNGCTDSTGEVVRAAMRRFPNLGILDIPAPVGKGGAVRCGFLLGEEAYVGFVDADASFAPEEFDRLFSRCVEARLDCAIGSRWNAESNRVLGRAMARDVASMAFRWIRTALFGLRFRDTQCGMKVFRRAAIAEILEDLELANFAFDVDILAQLAQRNAKVEEVPITWTDAAGTKIRLVSTAFSMMLALVRLRLRRSFLGNAPFVDLIARQSVMPVARRISLLVLDDGAGSAALRRSVDSLHERWVAKGYSVRTWPQRRAATPASAVRRIWDRLRLLMWYTFGTARGYDAIVEVAAPMPWGLPLVSAKPAFVLRDPDEAFSATYDRRYRERERIRVLSIRDEQTVFDDIYAVAALSSVYGARFLVSESGSLLVYADRASGTPVTQPLVQEAKTP